MIQHSFPTRRSSDLLGELLRPIREFVELRVPHENSAAIARLHSQAQVVERRYSGRTAHFKARIPPHLVPEFQAFIVENGNGKHRNGGTR